MLFAAAATAFFSCQKPEVIVPETSQEVTLTFASEKPAFDDETKTEWNGKTIQWSEGDKIAIAYTVNGTWQNASGNASGDAKLYKSEALKASSETAQFNVSASFTGSVEGTHIFYGVYPAPSETGFADAPVASLTISPIQNPKADSFDASADLMVGISDELGTRPGKDETISLLWNRLVAHAVITLKDINGLTVDETIKYITLTAQNDANLVGQQKVNLVTKEVVKDNNEANVLKLSADDLVVNNGTVTFWACFLPETLTSLTVVVETDAATYTREITGISKEFKRNARNTLAIKMNEAVRVETEADPYTVDVLTREVTGIEGTTYKDWSGKTLASGAVYAGNSAGGNESIQLRSNNSNSGVITTVSGGYAKKVVVKWNSNTTSGRILNVYGKSTAYTSPTELYGDASGDLLGIIKCGTSNELVIDGDYEYIGMRSNSGAMYIEQISISWAPDMTPKIVVAETEQSIGAEGGELTFAYTLKNLDGEAVTVDEASDFISADAADGTVTVTVDPNETTDPREATITLSCGSAEDVTLTVTQEGKVVVDSSLDGKYWIYEPTSKIVMAPIAESAASARPGNGNAEVENEVVSSFEKYAFDFTFDEEKNAYTIQDSYGRYIHSGYYNGNPSAFVYASASLPEGESGYWGISKSEDKYVIVNKDTNYELAYDSSYSNWSLYAADHGKAYPTLVKADNPLSVELSSISVSGQKTSFTVGDAFEFGGTVTATYNDGSTKTVTPTSVSTPDMTEGKHDVTVTYVENAVSKSVGYTITVNAAGGNGGESVVEGDAYTYSFTAKQFAANGEKVLGNLNWTLAGDGGYWGYDSTKGQQLGSGSKPYKLMTFSTSGYEGGVKKIVINTSGASSINATFTVTVNGVQYGASTKLTTSATTYTFEVDEADMQAGDIVFTYTQTSSKAIYIKSIAIN